jgi:hypothetical protein
MDAAHGREQTPVVALLIVFDPGFDGFDGVL